MKEVIVNLLTLEGFLVGRKPIFNAEQVVSESWNGEELLEHRVHVADAAKVSQADPYLSTSRRRRRRVVPSWRSLNVIHNWLDTVL